MFTRVSRRKRPNALFCSFSDTLPRRSPPMKNAVHGSSAFFFCDGYACSLPVECRRRTTRNERETHTVTHTSNGGKITGTIIGWVGGWEKKIVLLKMHFCACVFVCERVLLRVRVLLHRDSRDSTRHLTPTTSPRRTRGCRRARGRDPPPSPSA